MDCPLCKRERAYDCGCNGKNKVEDLLLRDLLRARKCSSTGDNVNPEEARLRAEVARQRAQIAQLQKLRLENAQLKKRNEELERSALMAKGKQDDDEVDDEDSLQESVTLAQEQQHTESSNATEPPLPPPPPNKWACSVCTYYNNIRRKTCEMGCGGKRV